MFEYTTEVRSSRSQGEAFTDNKYSRGHEWGFDGGAIVAASASPQIVPLPNSVKANFDPEEAFVAALSSCHVLFFLSIAANDGYVIEQYTDNAIGFMTEDGTTRMSMTKVILRPQVVFSGDRRPTFEGPEKMRHLSHVNYFVANSVKTEVVTEIIA